MQKTIKNTLNTLGVVLCLAHMPKALADFGGVEAETTTPVTSPVSADESADVAPLSTNFGDVLPWKDIKTWGKYLENIMNALEELKNSTLDEEEWEDYKDYYKRSKAVADLLRGGEPVYSGRSLGYLYVMISAYSELSQSEGYNEDISNTYDDDRTRLAKQLETETKKMMNFLVQDKHVTIVNGVYRINISSGNSIVRNFAKTLISIGEEMASEMKDANKQNAINWMVQQVGYIAGFKGGDGTRVVDNGTRELIDWYDAWNHPKINLFENMMEEYHQAESATKDRKTQFRRLAGNMDHLIGIMEAIKNHVGYGVGFEGKDYEDHVKQMRRK
ncbi:MAG: hypothetical protein KDD40_03185 [Bdellovibrionales bacterium]|nr:hypothetical protein [Bdellovibrionales bacterium]